MKSDGITTEIHLSYHPSRDNAPLHTDNDWISLTDNNWIKLGPPEECSKPKDKTEGSTIKCSYEMDFNPIITRYLRVEVKNDGSLGTPSYIEIRQIKAYCVQKDESDVFTSWGLKQLFNLIEEEEDIIKGE